MTLAEHVTKDGFKLRVFDSAFLDFGLEIVSPNGEVVYYSPHALSHESYGFEVTDDEEEFIEWKSEDWERCLSFEAWELLDCFANW